MNTITIEKVVNGYVVSHFVASRTVRKFVCLTWPGVIVHLKEQGTLEACHVA